MLFNAKGITMADYSYVMDILNKRGYAADPEISDSPDIVAYKEINTSVNVPETVTLLVHFYEENSEFLFEVVAESYVRGTEYGFSKDFYSTWISENPTGVPDRAVESWLDSLEASGKLYISALKELKGR